MWLPEGIACFVSVGVPGIFGGGVLNPTRANSDIRKVNEALVRLSAEFGGSFFRHVDLESGALLAFSQVSSAIRAARDIQVELTELDLLACIGLTTREAIPVESEYDTSIVDRVISLREVAHKGQIVLDAATVEIARSASEEFDFLPLGRRTVQQRELPEYLYQLLDPALARDFPPSEGSVRLENLPSGLTQFVGRWNEMEDLIERFYDSRAVTLCGPGGMGKTRMAVQVAWQLLPRLQDGAWFIDLSLFTDRRLIVDAIIRAIPWLVADDRPPLEILKDFMRRRCLLLIFDNAEHFADEIGRLILSISAECPNVAFLITSRQPLGIEGESVRVLEPLALPDEHAPMSEILQSEAVMLFLNRVRLLHPEYEPGQDAKALATLVSLVDGIPLAIEIIAAQSHRRPLAELIRSLRKSLHSLEHDVSLPSERQRKLAGTLEWGYSTLNPLERLVLHRISVFEGSFALDAAERVCAEGTVSAADVEPALCELVRCSLLMRIGERYRMLLPTRSFADEHLVRSLESPKFKDRHLDWAVELGKALAEDNRPEWMARVALEMPNIRKAIAWATGEDNDMRAFELGYAIYDYWYAQAGGKEGFDFLSDILKCCKQIDALSRVKLLNIRAILAMDVGKYSVSEKDLRAASKLALANGLDQARDMVEGNLCLFYMRTWRMQEAYEYGNKLLKRMGENNQRWAIQQRMLVNIATHLGLFEDAERRLNELDVYVKGHPSPLNVANQRALEASLRLRQRRYDDAQEILEATFLLWRDLQDVRGAGVTLGYMVIAVVGAGLDRQAALYAGCLERLGEDVDIPMSRVMKKELEDAIAIVSGRMAQAYEIEFQRGRRLSLPDIEQHLRDRLGGGGPSER